MKTLSSQHRTRALTLVEVLIVIAVLLVLVAMYLPTLANRNTRSSRISCVNNLKQVGLAFRIWQGDNNDKFPMSVSVTNGGTMELVESGTVWWHFAAMSNELNTPKILTCPNDSERPKNVTITWGDIPSAPYDANISTNNTNTSYFIGVDAADTSPNMFLAGDRNLTVKNIALNPGLHSLTTNEIVGWTAKLHVNQGNVLMADASVQMLSTSGLQAALIKTGIATNRLAMP